MSSQDSYRSDLSLLTLSLEKGVDLFDAVSGQNAILGLQLEAIAQQTNDLALNASIDAAANANDGALAEAARNLKALARQTAQTADRLERARRSLGLYDPAAADDDAEEDIILQDS